jgi:hypothetical protein
LYLQKLHGLTGTRLTPRRARGSLGGTPLSPKLGLRSGKEQ